MIPRPIILVAETSSLGAALHGLLEAEGYSVRSVRNARAAQTVLRRPEAERAMLVVASNAWSSETLTQWSGGALGHRPLVLVGTRDAHLRSHGNLHVIRLPVAPRELLFVVHHAANQLEPSTAPPARPGSPHTPRAPLRVSRSTS